MRAPVLPGVPRGAARLNDPPIHHPGRSCAARAPPRHAATPEACVDAVDSRHINAPFQFQEIKHT